MNIYRITSEETGFYDLRYLDRLFNRKITEYYYDETDLWLLSANPNDKKIIIDDYYLDDFGVKHPIKDMERVHQALKDSCEYQVAKIINNNLGGDIHLVPRITDITNSGIKTTTPDYLWNDEKWDLKTPGVSGKNIIERFFKHSHTKLQANCFIININNLNITSEEIINIVLKTLRNPYRSWIKKIIIIKDNKIFKVYSR